MIMFLSQVFRRYLFVVLALCGALLATGIALLPAQPPATAAPAAAKPTPASTAAPAQPVASPTCTPTWNTVTAPDVGSAGVKGSDLHGIDGSVGDLWAVGYTLDANQIFHTLIEHWNGSAWSIVFSPNAGTDSNLLAAVDVRAPDDVWAVGYAYDAGVTSKTLIEHWNGNAWSIVPSPNQGTGANYLVSVSALAANDVWAVGWYANATAWKTLTLHWDGYYWNVEPSPNVGTIDNTLQRVTVLATNNAWAVGAYRVSGTLQWRTLIEHWNGATWSVVSSPSHLTGNQYLTGVTGTAAGDLWAVGYYYDSTNLEQTMIQHWDGNAWTIVSSPNAGTGDNYLYTARALAADDIWAVGQYGGGNGPQTLTVHWDGSAWTVVPSANSGNGPNELYDLAVLAAGDVWAVGYHAAHTGDPNQVLIEHYAPACGPPCSIVFSDVPLDDPFYSYIHCLTCRSIVGGYADGTFRPGATVTRGQLAKFVANAAGYNDPIPVNHQTFSDVPPSHPFWLFIERAAAHGVVGGYADGTFRPGATVTRGQVAKFVSNAAGYNDAIPVNHQIFSDVPPTQPFWLYIERAAAHGVVGGYSDGTFRPGANVTRGQTSKFIGNSFFPNCQVTLKQ